MVITAAGVVAQTKPLVEVYKDPTCECCRKWVEHLRTQEFETKTTNVKAIGFDPVDAGPLQNTRLLEPL